MEQMNSNVEVISQEKINTEKIIELFKNGLGSKEECIGYHGTSIEAIEYLIKTGHLPGGTGDATSDTDVQRGDLYFYPLKSKFPNSDREFPDESVAVEETAIYANHIAQTHYFLKRMNKDLNNRRVSNLARFVVEDRDSTPEGEAFYEELMLEGFSREYINQTIDEAQKRKGVVIALSKKLLEKHTPTNGDEGEGDLKINFPNGLNYEYISGLEPVGEEDRKYFIDLQQKTNK